MDAQGGPQDPKGAQAELDDAVAHLVMEEEQAPDGNNPYSALPETVG